MQYNPNGYRKQENHGMSGTPEYNIWRLMLRRCYNKNAVDFDYYGGRGVTVCDRWRYSFMKFYADMGARPEGGHTLDRIDNDGPYSPDNCRWATRSEQQNNMRSNRRIEFDGRTQTLTQWANETGIDRTVLHMRIVQRGWTIERALTTMPRTYNKIDE